MSGQAVLLSLLIHLCAAVWFTWNPFFSKHEPRHAKPVVIEFEVRAAPPPEIRSRSKANRAKPVLQASPRVALKNLGVLTSTLSGREKSAVNSEPELPRDSGFTSDGGAQGGSAEKVATDQNHPLYQHIYQRIENHLIYPEELREAGHQGTVVGKLYFDSHGKYEGGRSVFKSADSYLRVNVIKILRKALDENIPDQMNLLKKSFFLECSFRFAITQHGDQELYRAQRLIVGNHFFFYRGFYQSKLEWQVGPLSGLGPFAAALNPLWFVSQATELFSNKAKLDPLQKYRDDPEW